ncbi:MAG: type II secretion system protein F [Gammaproteobacteria bacterium]|nr:type II secretion system protein F [Gammaproteobacteria bacterium]MAV41929.1 type II secretion system protein F [Flavobacteriaceae bacterium]|tara:strand:- start:4197 stop:5387 length:1191 start_codon:yes stop_codon:yes gene_type:complete
MPAFSYIAINELGVKKKGILSADSEKEARKMVKDLHLTPLKVSESKNTGKKLKVKNKDIVVMTRQLSILLDANTPIVDALEITASQLKNKNLIYVIFNLKEDIVQGKRLGNSMKKFPEVFSSTYISMVSAGDSSGNLDVVFSKLADYLEESASIRQKVTSAMTYPLILIGFSIIVIVSLLTFVLPQVINQFVKAGADLPFITKLLLGISNNIVLIISMSLLVWISIFYLYKNYVKNINNKIKAHKRMLKIPLIGNFLLNSELERFASTMELLLASGSNLDIALDESTKVFNNKYLENIITNSNNDVREGKDFINALKQYNTFPDIFIQLVSSGYRSGNLITMFNKVSHFMKSEIEKKRSIFLSLLEPVVIILMGGFVLLIVLAILIPIMQMNTLAI